MAEFLSPAISARLWFDSRLRHNAFKKPGLQTFRLPYHFIVASQWDGNPAFTKLTFFNLPKHYFDSEEKSINFWLVFFKETA